MVLCRTRRPYDPNGVYRDRKWQGRRCSQTRPQLAAALSEARRQKCPVVVAKFDRLSRDVAFVVPRVCQRQGAVCRPATRSGGYCPSRALELLPLRKCRPRVTRKKSESPALRGAGLFWGSGDGIAALQ